jgi:hypothetical protein
LNILAARYSLIVRTTLEVGRAGRLADRADQLIDRKRFAQIGNAAGAHSRQPGPNYWISNWQWSVRV